MADRGIALIYGPVLDPKGAYGLGIIEVESEDQVQALAAGDPAAKSGIGGMEIYPMLAVLKNSEYTEKMIRYPRQIVKVILKSLEFIWHHPYICHLSFD